MTKRTPTFAELIRLPVVFTLPGMDAVNVERDLVYKTADDQPLHMDVYSPPGTRRARPAVIVIHGGPIPRIGAKGMGIFVSHGQLLAASGLVAVTFNHRFLAPARVPDAVQDTADAVAYVRANAESIGVDPDRMALWAFSGGGALLDAPLRERPAWLRAIVGYYTKLDSAIESLGDGRSAPAMLIARAGLDAASWNETIDRFVQAAVTSGATIDLLNHADGRHSFDILDDEARSRQIIRNTLQFLADHLEP